MTETAVTPVEADTVVRLYRTMSLIRQFEQTASRLLASGELAGFLFKAPGPVLAVAKIALSEDPWALPEKDGAAIGYRFREALGVDGKR